MKKIILLLIVVCLPLGASTAYALPRVEDISRNSGSMEERVSRLEQMVQNLTQMLGQMDELQQEVQRLRGELDENNHKVEKLTKLQKDLYNTRADSAPSSPSAPSGNMPVAQSGQPVPAVNLASSDTDNRMITISDERGSYQAAQAMLQKRDYAGARKAFEKIVQDYPQGEMLANSYYWLGEINLIEGDLNRAKGWFTKIMSGFPEHAKAPDALYKLGNVAYTQGDIKSAKQYYREVTLRYPESASARLAASKLDTK